ncbi:hypothetical protein Hamer_G027099, partial [Homarus americanus]
MVSPDYDRHNLSTGTSTSSSHFYSMLLNSLPSVPLLHSSTLKASCLAEANDLTFGRNSEQRTALKSWSMSRIEKTSRIS